MRCMPWILPSEPSQYHLALLHSNIGASWRVTNEPTSGRCLSMEVVTSSSVSNGSRCYALCQKNQFSKTNERLGRILTDGQCSLLSIQFVTVSFVLPFSHSGSIAIGPAINSNDYSAPSMHLPPPLEPHQKLPGSPPPFLPLYEKFPIAASSTQTMPAIHKTVYSIPRVSDFTHCDPSDSHFALSRGRRFGDACIPADAGDLRGA
ncbi:hypothetical protein B0H14DRAFT_3152374 [Mycena olivaceomarginata]|nr:hypothetical protein B0H14DRAFT_3152374 [Mycena olivaceomarginata]